MPKPQSDQVKRSRARIVLLTVIAAILILVFILLAVLLAPEDRIPDFRLTDENRVELGADGDVAIFSEKIHPGSKGSYKFRIINAVDTDLDYGFSFEDIFSSGDPDIVPFMKYRLKRNGDYLDKEWRYASEIRYTGLTIDEESTQTYILEWEWPLEGGNDKNDTLVGVTGGNLTLVIHAWAEVHFE